VYKVKLEKFEGPLDLLLQLIEAEDLDINQIALARVADDFVAYANAQTGIPLEELSDFLLVASKLLYIKSKSLLPYLIWDEEEEEAVGLEEQLKLYRAFLEASKKLEGLIKEKKFFHCRERISVPPGFYPPANLTQERMRDFFAAVLNAIEPFIKIEKKVREQVVSIRQKIDDLKVRIAQKAKMGFREFVQSAKNKTEVIVSFLALLEMVKQRIIFVEQKDLFSDIEISGKPESEQLTADGLPPKDVIPDAEAIA
jgi:segregation and condensation protein A